ncbi:MAG: sugar transferase, partial [Pseudomonadota bacterium]
PQLFNVLRGDMSLVGPRPIIAPDVPGYPGDKSYFNSADFAYYSRCTPGITGLWQVSGRSSTRHDERVRLDRWYSRNWSFWLDLMILLKTVRVVIMRSGSI